MNDPRRWFLLASAPLLTQCPGPIGDCGLLGGPPQRTLVSWDGGLADGGVGPLDAATCLQLCNSNACTVADAGLIECRYICVGGRAPPGLVALSGTRGDAGSWLSRMAELEQAAVYAFLHLSKELAAHGLQDFSAAALNAAAHEVAHAEAMTRLALRFGFCPAPVEVRPTEVRSLEAMALDNAGEGCGRELFGASLNAHQALHSTEPDIRQALATIAVDEAAHARLSLELAEALSSRLTLPQRRRHREAQAQALTQLGDDAFDETARRTLGLPDTAARQVLAHRLLEAHTL